MVRDDQLKPNLLHPDPWVRSAVAGYFGDSWSRDPELAGLILEGCERFGLEGPAHCHLYQLPLGERDFDGVLDLMERLEWRSELFPLSRCLGTVSLPLLKARADRVSRIPLLSKSARLLVEERLEYAASPKEELWKLARDFSLRPEEMVTFDGFNQARRQALIDALASRDVPDDGTVMRLLGSREIAGSRFELNLVCLAGARRIREAVPFLVPRLSAEDYDLPAEAVEALARIGDPDAARLIRSRFHSEEQSCRIDAANLLGLIKSLESEQAILALLQEEEDPDVRQSLYTSLCDLFSREAAEVVRAAIVENPGDGSLQLTLLPVLDVLGVQVPEAEQWRRSRDERRTKEGIEEAKAASERLHQIMEEGEEAVEEKRFLEEQARSFGWLSPEEPVEQSPRDTIIREQPKVGRNDPCPCGSGKKHKFCCGRG